MKLKIDKIPKDDIEKIRIAASWLPMVFKKSPNHDGIPGGNLMRMKVLKDWKNNKISPLEVYRKVDHSLEMCRAYMYDDGIMGVERYLENYKEYLDQLQTAKQQENGNRSINSAGSHSDPSIGTKPTNGG